MRRAAVRAGCGRCHCGRRAADGRHPVLTAFALGASRRLGAFAAHLASPVDVYVGRMGDVAFERIAPVVTVHDLGAALARYEKLGFAIELDEPAQYGFVDRGAVQLHLVADDPDDPGHTGAVVYLYVSDADALLAEWTASGVDGRFIGPHDTPYGLREFVYIDPDGIVHRVGSPL